MKTNLIFVFAISAAGIVVFLTIIVPLFKGEEFSYFVVGAVALGLYMAGLTFCIVKELKKLFGTGWTNVFIVALVFWALVGSGFVLSPLFKWLQIDAQTSYELPFLFFGTLILYLSLVLYRTFSKKRGSRSKMKTPKFFLLVFLSVSFFHSAMAQSDIHETADIYSKADKILDRARKMVFQNTSETPPQNIFISTSADTYTRRTTKDKKPLLAEKREHVIVEYSLKLPDFIKTVAVKKSDRPIKDAEIWIISLANKNKVALSGKVFVDGQKINVGKGPREFLETDYRRFGVKEFEPSDKNSQLARTGIDSRVSSFILPLIFQDTRGETPSFKYLGKAVAAKKEAWVLEKVSENREDGERKIKYFFDTESNLLLMITKEWKSNNMTSNTSVYFSRHKIFNGILDSDENKKGIEGSP